MGAVLAFDTVGFRHGTGAETLSNVGFELLRGQIAVVTGAGGSGKSALAGLAGLALRPNYGRLTLFDRDAGAASAAARRALRRRIGFIGDALPLLPQLSVRDNVALPLGLLGVGGEEAEGRVAELLGWLALGARIDARPDALSRAERERVSIARAVIGRPELLIADDPLSAPDAAEGARVVQLFARLADIGSAVLILGRATGWTRPLAARDYRLEAGRLVG